MVEGCNCLYLEDSDSYSLVPLMTPFNSSCDNRIFTVFLGIFEFEFEFVEVFLGVSSSFVQGVANDIKDILS